MTDATCRYPFYNATLFDGDSPVLGMLLTVKLDLVGSIAVTVACMTVICSLFIPHPLGVGIVAFTISSICFSEFRLRETEGYIVLR